VFSETCIPPRASIAVAGFVDVGKRERVRTEIDVDQVPVLPIVRIPARKSIENEDGHRAAGHVVESTLCSVRRHLKG
jgi:hypothetical protein